MSEYPQPRSRKHLRSIGLILLCFLLLPSISASVDDQRFQSYIEKHANGWIDWKTGLIYGIGIGDVKKNRNNRPLAQGVGGVLASGNIVKLAAGLHLDDARTLKSLGDGKVVIKLKAFIRDRVYKKTFFENNGNPYYEVIKVASMKGISGLTARLLDTLAKDPIWHDLPIKSPKQQTSLDAGEGPWLILDARNLPDGEKIQPALLPKIKSETGEDIYDVKQVEQAALVNRGMMSYVVTDTPAADLRADSGLIDRILAAAGLVIGVPEAQAVTREGNIAEIPMFGRPPVRQAAPVARKSRRRRGKYIVVDVNAVQGLTKTNLVISARDALELKDEDASSQILRKCRVIVVVSSPVGGVEGNLPIYMAKK